MSEPANDGAEMRLLIDGDSGTIDVAALYKALGALLELLKAGGVEANMVVSDLRQGSAEIAVRPRFTDSDVETRFATIVKGLSSLSDEQIDGAWSVPMLEGAELLAGTLDFTGVAGVRVSTPGAPEATVTATTRKTAQQALRTSSVSIGSVTGRMHRLVDNKSKREMSLTDLVTDRAVTVTFRQDQESRLVEAFGLVIEAWGELRRDRDGRKTSLKLDDFRVVDAAESAPSLDDLQGVLGADWTNGQGSVEAVRAQRDDE